MHKYEHTLRAYPFGLPDSIAIIEMANKNMLNQYTASSSKHLFIKFRMWRFEHEMNAENSQLALFST